MPETPFDDIDGEDEPAIESDNLKKVRDYAKAQERRAKAAEKDLKELEGLREYKEQNELEHKVVNAVDIFRDLGLPEAQAALFVEKSKDVSKEAALSFAQTYGLSPKAEEVAAAAEQQHAEGFRPVTDPSAAIVDGASYGLDQVQELLKSGDTAKIQELAAAGRLNLEKLNIGPDK